MSLSATKTVKQIIQCVSAVLDMRKFGRMLLGGIVAIALIPSSVLAQDEEAVDEIVVTADPVGLTEVNSTDSVFGTNRSLTETPRSISIISATTMERYGIEDIDDFITTTPGTFGGSFFGVPGAITIRGSVSETYFRGFKRALNQGLFPTPLGASERVEIVRGPVPIIYGAGRVGGLLNFYPKTVSAAGMKASDGATGSLSYTAGSYSKNNFTAEANIPFLIGGRESGLSVYGEIEDSEHYFRGREPQHELLQLAFTHEMDNGFSFEVGGMYYHSDGYFQTAGWNRLTQDLIDNGTYITGRDTDLVDIDGNGRLTPDEIDPVVGTFFGTSNIRTLIDFGIFAVPAAYGLDTGLGTTQLGTRTVFLSNQAIAESDSLTGYIDLNKEFDNSKLSFQLFFDNMEGDIYVSTGFAAQHEMDVFEARASYEFGFELNDLSSVDFFLTASHRTYESELRENFLSGYLVLDRRDLSVGAQGNDIFDSPFTQETGGIGWDSNYDSEWSDTGIALVTDIKIGGLGIILGGRYDSYDVESIDTGTTIFDPSLANVRLDNDDNEFSWSVSVSYSTPVGLVPYITYAEGSELNDNSNGGVSPGPVRDGFLFGSQLTEYGVKFNLMDGSLFGAAVFYDQERQIADPFGNVNDETSEGFEFEMSYLISDNWSMTGAFSKQEFNIPPPGFCFSGQGEFLVIPPTHPVVNLFGTQVTAEQGYGGIFAALNASCLPELQGGYERKTIPDTVATGFLTYTSDETRYGVFGATFGGTHVAKTSGVTAGAVVLPSYTVYRAAAFAEMDRYQITATVDNVFDKRYFQPLQGVYQEVSVLPGIGRTFRIKATVSF